MPLAYFVNENKELLLLKWATTDNSREKVVQPLPHPQASLWTGLNQAESPGGQDTGQKRTKTENEHELWFPSHLSVSVPVLGLWPIYKVPENS
jgi:hypothetical protein